MLSLAGNPMPEMGGAEGRYTLPVAHFFLSIFLCVDIFPLSSNRFKTCVRFYARIQLLLRPDLVPGDRQGEERRGISIPGVRFLFL